MTGREGRQGTACVSHLQTRELKSTHQVKTLFDLLPPHHPQVPVEDKWMNGDIFYFLFIFLALFFVWLFPLLKPAEGMVVLVEERQV